MIEIDLNRSYFKQTAKDGLRVTTIFDCQSETYHLFVLKLFDKFDLFVDLLDFSFLTLVEDHFVFFE